jgi:hypothetical protein
MNNLVIKRSQLVEFQVTGTPTTLKRYAPIPVPNLSRNNIVLYGIEVFTADQLSDTPSGNVVIPSVRQNQAVVTFVDVNKDQFIYNFPIFSGIRANVGGFVTLFQPRLINLTDCYLQLTDATGIAGDQVVAVNLYYQLVGE